MITLRRVYEFLQIVVFDDRAESEPVCTQFRMGSPMIEPFAEFIKKNIDYADHIRDTYHDEQESRIKYHQGNVDSFVIYDRNPIVLISLPAFLQFRLVIGTDVLTADRTDLEEIVKELLGL